ncbi:hypothetical protein [Pseudomonas sp. Sample_22]|uniref:hypothetical protein n=1 Tax=Pseudomonas sp. Sample_22 TaxID=2448266 RepID=UPI00103301CB|nr:hypothetical protein [Pseudomonas sp. Sample_22]
MASTQSKSQRKKANADYLKLRSDYRARLAEKPILLDGADFVDPATKKILHGPRLAANQKLTVKIPRWTGTPPEDYSDIVTLFLDKGDGAGFVEAGNHEFKIHTGEADFRETFPFAMDIPRTSLPLDATCQLKYVIYYYNGEDEESDPVEFLCDQVKPYDGIAPIALTLATPFLDDNNLPAAGKLDVTVPASTDYQWKDGDAIAIYLVDAANIPENPIGLTPVYFGLLPDPGVAGATVSIPAAAIRGLGDTDGVFIYVLRDQALNDSVVSYWTKVSLTFGPLPTPLDSPTVPQADPGPLLVEHARDGVSVWIKRHTAYKAGDTVELTWGSTVVMGDFPIPVNADPEIEIPVTPSRIMLEEYGQSTTGDIETAISYKVFRKGRPFGPASKTIKVNFEVAIPWLPWPPVEEWPVPWHPSLLKGVVENHDKTRTNQLSRADKNEKAFFTFTWYAQAVNGHVVDFYWNGLHVVEAQLTFDDTAAPGPGHKPGDDVTVEIPWRYISEGGNDPKVPVQYRVSATGLENDLPSEITEVDVNAIAVELPRAEFPSVTGNFPNCASLEANGDLRVEIPDLSSLLKVGDKIHVVFTPMTGESGAETPIPGAEFEKDFILGTDGDITGFEFPVTPYATHIKPLFDKTAPNRRGRMKIQYFFNDGTEEIGSIPYTRITAFHDGAGECPISRP